mmetsp:Transcript_16047/g.60686  ORF Transcript_16047/g.60686 Transcript_16047/m.60686 type:complete len:278 (+) Transcript_16047:1941-2774(+)
MLRFVPLRGHQGRPAPRRAARALLRSQLLPVRLSPGRCQGRPGQHRLVPLPARWRQDLRPRLPRPPHLPAGQGVLRYRGHYRREARGEHHQLDGVWRHCTGLPGSASSAHLPLAMHSQLHQQLLPQAPADGHLRAANLGFARAQLVQGAAPAHVVEVDVRAAEQLCDAHVGIVRHHPGRRRGVARPPPQGSPPLPGRRRRRLVPGRAGQLRRPPVHLWHLQLHLRLHLRVLPHCRWLCRVRGLPGAGRRVPPPHRPLLLRHRGRRASRSRSGPQRAN